MVHSRLWLSVATLGILLCVSYTAVNQGGEFILTELPVYNTNFTSFFFLPHILPRHCQVNLKHLSNTPCFHSSQLISCNRNRNTAQADLTEEKTLSAQTGLGKFKAISIEAYKVVQFLFFILIIIIKTLLLKGPQPKHSWEQWSRQLECFKPHNTIRASKRWEQQECDDERRHSHWKSFTPLILNVKLFSFRMYFSKAVFSFKLSIH